MIVEPERLKFSSTHSHTNTDIDRYAEGAFSKSTSPYNIFEK